MFTGIVSGLGTLVAREGSQFVIHTPYKRKSLELGASTRLRRMLSHAHSD